MDCKYSSASSKYRIMRHNEAAALLMKVCKLAGMSYKYEPNNNPETDERVDFTAYNGNREGVCVDVSFVNTFASASSQYLTVQAALNKRVSEKRHKHEKAANDNNCSFFAFVM